MLLARIIRGNVITFTVSFIDADDESVTPASARLFLSYMYGGERIVDELEMTEASDGTWSAEWDSSIADTGRVHWSARSFNPSSAQDGQFELKANLANPDETSA